MRIVCLMRCIRPHGNVAIFVDNLLPVVLDRFWGFAIACPDAPCFMPASDLVPHATLLYDPPYDADGLTAGNVYSPTEHSLDKRENTLLVSIIVPALDNDVNA